MTYNPTDKLDTQAAAKYCGLGKSTLEKMRLIGGGPVYLKPNRKVVYQVSDLEAWLNARRFNSTSSYESKPTTNVSAEVEAEIRARYEIAPSPEAVEAAMTEAGGWTKAQLAAWGVSWPPVKGWRADLAARWKAQQEAA